MYNLTPPPLNFGKRCYVPVKFWLNIFSNKKESPAQFKKSFKMKWWFSKKKKKEKKNTPPPPTKNNRESKQKIKIFGNWFLEKLSDIVKISIIVDIKRSICLILKWFLKNACLLIFFQIFRLFFYHQSR